MSTTISPSDTPTLRVQLDKLIQDQQEFSKNLSSKQQQIESLYREIEQYKGALAYMDIIQKRLNEEIKTLTTPTPTPTPTK